MKIDSNMIVDELGIEPSIRFKTQAEISDPKYALYAWVDEHPGEWTIKVGSARTNGIAYRLSREQGIDVFNRVIGLWEPGAVNGKDGQIHKALKREAEASSLFRHANEGKRGGTLSEVYMFSSLAGLHKILGIIDDVVKSKNAIKIEKPLFSDIKHLVNEIASDNSEKFVLDLCTRWGKTRTALELVKANAKTLGTKVSVMMSYVGTAKRSYADEIATNSAYDGIELVDPDAFDSEKECESKIHSLIDAKKHVFYYFALTGSCDNEKSCFKRRLASLLRCNCKMDMYVDEADFGAKTERQIDKIHKIWNKCNFIKFYGMTGTNSDYVKRMWPDEKLSVYKRDYIIDVLKAGERKEAVNLSWHVLDNASLAEVIGSTAAMENFSGMCEIVNDHLKEETYFKQLLRWLYLNDASFDPRKFREQAKARLVDPDYATMVFLPNDKSCHSVFAKLIESCIPGARTVVVNGDETTNAEAEQLVKAVIDDNALHKKIPNNDPRRGRGVFIIAAGMANRSFSVKEIKNILLLVNGGEYSSIMQKIARGLTPYAYDPLNPFTAYDSRRQCNVIDFRLTWQWPRLSAWLSGLGIEVMKRENHMTQADAFKMINDISQMTDKITFDEYSWNGLEPVKMLDENALLAMMQTRDFQKERMIHLADLDTLPAPMRCELDEDIEVFLPDCNNVKGDSSKRIHKVKLIVNACCNSQKNEEDDEVNKNKKNDVDWKLQHLNFIWNHADWLSTPECKTLSKSLSCMSKERMSEYERQFGIDMDFIYALVEHLKSKNFEIKLSEID